MTKVKPLHCKSKSNEAPPLFPPTELASVQILWFIKAKQGWPLPQKLLHFILIHLQIIFQVSPIIIMTKRLKTRSWHQIPSSLFWALGISCRDNFSQLQLSWMTGVIPAYNLTSSSGSHGLHLTIQYTVKALNTLYTLHKVHHPPRNQPSWLNWLMWRLFPGGRRTTTWEHFHQLGDDQSPPRDCKVVETSN